MTLMRKFCEVTQTVGKLTFRQSQRWAAVCYSVTNEVTFLSDDILCHGP